ncbi:MAG: alpha/beta fold hydrolase [Sporichthyaceae bacterium]
MELPVQHFCGRDGATLAYREVGTGCPLILIHGYFSTAVVNWVKYGHAGALAERGFRVVMPDLRAHGDSDASHEAAAYPPDVLTDDGLAFIEHLGLSDGAYDLGGYSLGGRTVARMLVRGAAPRRAVVAGMGLDGILRPGERVEHFRHILTNLGSHAPRTPAWMAEAFLRTVGGDPVALLRLLDTFVDTSIAELAAVSVPTLVVCGAEDDDNGSAAALAAALADGRHVSIPGTHMGAVTRPELRTAIAEFLTN